MKALFLDNDLKKILAFKAASLFKKFPDLGGMSPVQYGEIEEPQIPDERWVKVKNKSCGLCGTDIHFMFMDMDVKCFPAALPGISRKYLGHESLGEVIEAGAEAGSFSRGDRVSLRIDWPSCFQMEINPPCRQCSAGNYMLCENLGQKAPRLLHAGGGFSPFMVLHKTQPYKIPDFLDDSQALLLEPAACAVHGIMKKRPDPGDRVLVIGAGTIGLLCVAMAKTITPEAEVVCLARYPYQAEAAERLGADSTLLDHKDLYGKVAELTGGKHIKGYLGNEIILGGFDLVYDSVGNDHSIQNSLRWIRGGGSLVILGLNFKPGKIDYSPIWNQEITVVGINCHANESPDENTFDMTARLLRDSIYPVQDMITHRFPMEQYREAVKTFLNKKETKAIKIVLDHEN